MIKRERKLEIGKIHFYNTFEHFWLKFVLALKIMNVENASLTKVVHFYVIKNMDA
jgi:hypothetical protein